MEPISNIITTCPHCGSSNVVIYKRGYSLLLGILGMIVFFFAYAIFWIISTDYGNQSAEVQNMMVALSKDEFIIAGLLGLLGGFIGKNKLKGKCMICKRRFSI